MARSARRRRLDKQALFSHLGYEPHEGQWAVHRSLAPRRVVACGARWGKSTCAGAEAVAAALAPAKESMGWVVAPTYDLCDRIFRQILFMVRSRLSEHVIAIKDQDRRILLCNLGGGVSEIRAKSADNPASLLGEALDWVVLDEASRLPDDIWERYVAQRLVDRNGWALMLSTPRGLNWFFRAFKLGQKGRDQDYESWRAPSWDNPHIPTETIDGERKRLPAAAFGQEFGGEFEGEEDDPCDVCGCPADDAPGLVILHDDEQLPECPECADAVNEEGRTLVKRWPDGSPHLSIVVCHRNIGESPALPKEVEALIAEEAASDSVEQWAVKGPVSGMPARPA